MAESVKLIPRELKEMQFPEARFLTEEEQARYDEACKSYGKRARASLDVYSNLFKVLKLNEIGIKTAGLFDLELALENGMDLRETYEDVPAVVLRSSGDSYKPNDYLAKSLAKLIKKRDFPHAVVIEGLKPEEDSNLEYGLSLLEGERFRIVESPDLDDKNNRRRFKRINPDYTIEFDDNGRRTLHTRDDGVSRLCLDWDLLLGSGYGDLADSFVAGRVVVVSGEATSPKILDEYISGIKAESTKQMKEIAERARKAENYLRIGKLE